MSNHHSDYYYWGVDFPGMSQSQANELLEKEKERVGGLTGSLVDPEQFPTQHMDKSTIETLLIALEQLSDSPRSNDSADNAAIRSMIEEFENWLRFATRRHDGGPA